MSVGTEERSSEAERTAIVTGGGSGIGLAIGTRLAGDGMAVAIFDRDGEAAKAAAADIDAVGGRAMALAVDVTDRAGIAASLEEVRSGLGSPTVLVNNAGIEGFDKFLDITPGIGTAFSRST